MAAGAPAEARAQSKIREGNIAPQTHTLNNPNIFIDNKKVSSLTHHFPLHHNPNASTADQRQHILSQILTPDAADRLGRIRLVKESRATDIENRLIMLARTGQIRQKVSEDQLKDILGAVAEQNEKEESKIVVNRRGGGGWDEDEELEELMKDV